MKKKRSTSLTAYKTDHNVSNYLKKAAKN